MIEAAGFQNRGHESYSLTPAQAGKFYDVHQERPFYNDLCAYMSSGPIIAVILEKGQRKSRFQNFVAQQSCKCS